MELLERSSDLNNLVDHFHRVEKGSGHTLFLMGEAGIGKTSLVNQFIKSVGSSATIYSGACDSLFTPRPLGPLYDIAAQIGPDFIDLLRNEKDRSIIFAALVQKLASPLKPVVLIFEDIHWTDEATIDLIKFLARRIYHHRCLFLLTYRNNEITSRHPLKNIFGELPVDAFSKLLIQPLSREAVNHLTKAKGYASGDDVYSLTGGNPFYVTEILASYSPGIPERVKDSILAVYNARKKNIHALWEILSIFPLGIELSLAEKVESNFPASIESCVQSGVIVNRQGSLIFKHELYRIAIEESIAHDRRKSLHSKILKIMLESPEHSSNLSQLVHHARFADEKELIIKLAPQAAKEAAAVGAHIEASKLYLTAIEFTNKQNPTLADLYEHHAYECYLINQIPTAIASQQNAYNIYRDQKIKLREGDTLRFLSRLWWFEGDRSKAFALALQSIEVLENSFLTRERGLAYSNLSQLYMLSEDLENTLLWGNQAIDLAVQMEDDEIRCHALNNVGAILIKYSATENEGEEKLIQSLSIALKNGFDEHAARAYTNLSSEFVLTRHYEKAMNNLNVGLKYCEERDLNSWMYYMLSWKTRLLLETGKWDEAEQIANRLQSNPHHPNIVKIGTAITLARLHSRRGQFEEAGFLIQEAKTMAMPTHEAQRIIPALIAELEMGWISGNSIQLNEIQKTEASLVYERGDSWHYSEFVYWLNKNNTHEAHKTAVRLTKPYQLESEGDWKSASDCWRKTGCAYEQALALFNGEEKDKKQALIVLDELGATATHEMLKSKLKGLGVKNIPRGPRESTRSNPLQLTNRQIDVLALLKDGLQNAEIADRLFISAKTVDHHISAILSKLGTNTRAKAVNEARRLGILN